MQYKCVVCHEQVDGTLPMTCPGCGRQLTHPIDYLSKWEDLDGAPEGVTGYVQQDFESRTLREIIDLEDNRWLEDINGTE
jgi:hypothetical protein